MLIYRIIITRLVQIDAIKFSVYTAAWVELWSCFTG